MQVRSSIQFIVAFLVTCAAAHFISAQQPNPAVTFSNIATQAGINFKHENGATPQKFMPETMSAGGLIFDYNSDG